MVEKLKNALIFKKKKKKKKKKLFCQQKITRL